METFPENKILIVDDERTARYGMSRALAILHAQIDECSDGQEALHYLAQNRADIVLCDINMPKVNGLEFLRRLRETRMDEKPLVIVVTAYGSEKIAVEAMKAGAYDYLSKPYDIDELRLLVGRALEKIRLERENIELKKRIAESAPAGLLGNAPAMLQVRRLIEKAAPTDVTVLLVGASGTGKELAARTIHSLSSRAGGPYVTMNCAAIPRDLVESELFGHEKGAFTGASSQRLGKFELAHGGTLFLDEIADMSLETQAKILRILEDKTFTRLGGKEVIKADVRLISATNKDLQKEMEIGAFRADLYYRLKVFEIRLPALVERKEDIPLLVEHYLHLFAERHRRPVKAVEPAVLRMLMNYHWPGNVRELVHVIEQSVILAESEILTTADLPQEIVAAARIEPEWFSVSKFGETSFTEMKERFLEKFERKVILSALEQTNGNVSQAARLLKIKRQNLQVKLKALGISPIELRKR